MRVIEWLLTCKHSSCMPSTVAHTAGCVLHLHITLLHASCCRQLLAEHHLAYHLLAAADALARGAKALEERSPAEASALYLEAIEYYENDGKESQVQAEQVLSCEEQIQRLPAVANRSPGQCLQHHRAQLPVLYNKPHESMPALLICCCMGIDSGSAHLQSCTGACQLHPHSHRSISYAYGLCSTKVIPSSSH